MKNIVKNFGAVQVLKNVELNIKKGEIVSLMGENGAGKSTLMKILSGAYSKDSYQGEIFIDKDKKSFNTPKDAEDSGIVMIYQENSALLDMSIAENIFVGNYPIKANKCIDWKKVYKETQELLDLMGLKMDPKQKMRKLSGSEQQLVAILKAVSKKAKILILDEPTSSLTSNETQYLFNIIKDLSKKGIACIYISHKLDEVFSISDRIVVLLDGTISGQFNKGEFEVESILNCMLGRGLSEMFPKSEHQIGEEIFKIENYVVRHPYNKDMNIVSGMNLTLRKGEVVGLAGLVGSGRSELVNSIFGYLKKQSGITYLNNEEIQIKNPFDAVKNKLGLLVEDRKKNGLVLIHSISNNFMLANLNDISKNGIIDKNREKEKSEKLFKDMNVKAVSINSIVHHLSGGNQQKIALGKWLNTNPDVLFLDEPTRGIDVGSKVEIYKHINNLALQGVAVLIISSEFAELLGVCDRIVVVRHGKDIGEYTPKELDESKLLSLVSGV